MLLTWLIEASLVHWYLQYVTVHHISPSVWIAMKPMCRTVITLRAYCLSCFDYIHILCSSYFCKICALCVSWVASNYSFIMFLAWFIEQSFGSFIPTMCDCTSCVQVHGLPWGQWHIDNKWEGTLFVFFWLHIYCKIVND